MPANDAIAVLRADHAVVKGLFAVYEVLGDRADNTKHKTVQKICQALTLHAAIEEEIFYPRVRRAGVEEKDDVLEGVEDIAVIKQLVSEIEALTPSDETFDAKVKVLRENVQHHVEEEESEMFPHVRKAIREAELTELGERLAAAKQERLSARAS